MLATPVGVNARKGAMTFLQTTRTILLLTGIAGVSCFYLVSEFLLQDRFSILEEEAVRHQIERSVNVYDHALDGYAGPIHLNPHLLIPPAHSLTRQTMPPN